MTKILQAMHPKQASGMEAAPFDLSEDELRLVRHVRSLPPSIRGMIMEVAKRQAEHYRHERYGGLSLAYSSSNTDEVRP